MGMFNQYKQHRLMQEIFRLYKAGDIENVSIARLGGMQKLAYYLSRHWSEVIGSSIYERAASVVAILINYKEGDI